MASQSHPNQQRQLTEQITSKELTEQLSFSLNEPAPDEASSNSPSNKKTSDLRILLTNSITASTDSKHWKQNTEGSDINHTSYASTDSLPSTSLFGHSYTRSNNSNCTTVTVIDDCVSTCSPRDNSYLSLSPINKHQAFRNKTYNKSHFLYPKTFNNNPPVLSDIQHIPNAGHIMTQCPTNKGTGSAGNNASNHKNNNGHNDGGNKASDKSGNGWNNRGGSGGNNNKGWKGRDGDDEKKRENNINMDKYEDDIKDEEEEDDEDEEDDEFDAMNCTPIHKPAPYISLRSHSRSKSLNSGFKRRRKSNSARARIHYGYTGSGPRAQGCIEIPRQLTGTTIPEHIKHQIENVYDFMDKTTGIALMDGHILHMGNCKILNYGFHAKDSSSSSSSSGSMYGDELYLVADNIMSYRQSKVPFVMRDTLYTKQDICNIFNVKEHDLPRSCVDLNRDNVQSDMAILSDVFAKNTFYENVFTKWSKLPIFHGKKDYNTRRITFSVTKPMFLSAVTHFGCNERSKLIPIVMFIGNGYRVEYLHIVKIEKEKSNIDIGISYAFDPCYNRLEATGIHLDKDSILRQHQLIAPNHHCQCFDDFQCDIDDLHIGNPDDDKNIANAYKDQIADLKQKLYAQNQKIINLMAQNCGLMRRDILYAQSCPKAPSTPPTPHRMPTPSTISCFTPTTAVRDIASPFSITADRSLSSVSSGPYYTPPSSSAVTKCSWSQYMQDQAVSPTGNQYNNRTNRSQTVPMIPLAQTYSGSWSSNGNVHGNVHGNNYFNASNKNRKNNTKTLPK